MLRTTPPAAAAVAVAALLAVGTAAPASADGGSFLGSVECGSNGGPGCRILLTWLLRNGGLPGSGGGTGTGGGTGADGSAGAPADGGTDWSQVDWDAVDWDAVDWSQVDWDAVDWDAVFGGEGAEGTAGTDPLTALQESLASFELPPPTIVTSPGADSLVLVNTPVWLWVDTQEWGAESASAEIADLSLTVTATPVATAWTLGDGTRIECEGPGTPYDPAVHAPDAPSPDCGHVYTRPSPAGGAHTVTVEVAWDTGWRFSDGTAGTLNQLVTTSQVELTVVESQGLVTGAGPR
ncbi:hypothetical protein [Nocardiopsis sp. FR4]|uniref:hypothetical protein n=1 Tax=Nocardiopsis sp. FR4 TaxID=2605985 RepID=UPI001356A88C|nr:hypothetical protein [Nocardiopsis sp. FR4]